MEIVPPVLAQETAYARVANIWTSWTDRHALVRVPSESMETQETIYAWIVTQDVNHALIWASLTVMHATVDFFSLGILVFRIVLNLGYSQITQPILALPVTPIVRDVLDPQKKIAKSAWLDFSSKDRHAKLQSSVTQAPTETFLRRCVKTATTHATSVMGHRKRTALSVQALLI